MTLAKPKETQYSEQFEIIEKKGDVKLGPTSGFIWRKDPRHLCFLLSRYKFCSKILSGKQNILEIGCGDAFGTRLVLQTVKKIHAVDFDPLFISYAKKLYENEEFNISFEKADLINDTPINGPFDGIYALDFLEHINPKYEDRVFKNILKASSPSSIIIFGMPNITTLPYASEASKKGHINLKNAEALKSTINNYYKEVIIFSMNDEVVHTGFYPMANYLFGIGFYPKH